MREYELIRLENSLSDYFLQEYKIDRHTKDTQLMYKYRGLNIQMSYRYIPLEAFIVRIGMMEATFKLMAGEKVAGSLGGSDERIIYKWLDRADNKACLKNIWIYTWTPENGMPKDPDNLNPQIKERNNNNNNI